ncbi:MAG TPA: hypothetical protein DD435_09595 [Cyanobacteria bacterium UBA8530]|nr:hypothetical protein [Cyanobacteria bacterium UBA8530]
MNKLLLGTTIAATVLAAQAALAIPVMNNSAETYKPGHGLASLGVSYGMQTGNRDDSGNFKAMPAKTGFTQLLVPLTLRLGLMDNLEGMIALPVNMNTTTPAAGSAQSSTGIGNVAVSLKYQLMHQAGIPATILSSGSTDAAYDGSMDLSLAVTTNTPTGKTIYDKLDAAKLGSDVTAWNKMDVGAALLTAKRWGAFKLTSNLGYYYSPEVDIEATKKVAFPGYLTYGLTGEYAVMDNAGFMLEIQGGNDLDSRKVAGVAVPQTQYYGLILNPGIQCQPMDNLNLSLTCQVPVAGRNSQDYVRPTLTASYIF